MSGTFNDRGELEPSSAAFIVAVGKKGSGKTIMTNAYAQAWPFDMVVLDVAGDDGPMPRKPGTGSHDFHDITGTVPDLPHKWPEHLRADPPRPMVLRYVPDPGSPTELDDLDAMVGLAYNHSSKDKPCLLVIHEVGRVWPVNRTPPNGRRVVNHSRHHALTVLADGPRPLTIETLVMAQADVVYIFELKSPRDRKRVADTMGWDGADIDAAVAELGRHEYLRYDAREPKPEQPGDEDQRVLHLPALPEDYVAQVKKWADGEPVRAVSEGPHAAAPVRRRGAAAARR